MFYDVTAVPDSMTINMKACEAGSSANSISNEFTNFVGYDLPHECSLIFEISQVILEYHEHETKSHRFLISGIQRLTCTA